MTTRLPLVAAQPGIWMAERLSTLPGAWSVAHYVELRGDLDPALLGRAIVTGLRRPTPSACAFAKITAKPGSGSMSIALCRT
jgi:enterobactin synthetase component F